MIIHSHELELMPALVVAKPAAHHLLTRAIDRLRRSDRKPRVANQRLFGERLGELDERWLTAHKVHLTPELAQTWLARLHPSNTGGWQHENVTRYTDLIRAGKWLGLTPVVFTPKGFLVDGKHRCAAVIAAGMPIWVFQTTAIVDELGLW